MRESGKRRKEEHATVESSLGHCLLDSDAESLRLARSTRWRSMLLSSGIQAMLLTAAVVVPLFATSDLVANRILGSGPFFTPVEPRPAPAQQSGPASGRPHTGTVSPVPITPVLQPDHIPDRTAMINDIGNAPPVASDGGSSIPGVPGGVGDPTIFGNGRNLPPPPPPVDTRPRGPIRVSVMDPSKLIHKVDPVYPALMRQIRKSGRVEFRAVIAKDGTIRELTLVGGDPGFVQSAQAAVMQWRYSPTLLNGEAVEVETRITVVFVMTP